MTDAHANMGVTNGELDAFMQDLVATLNDLKVGEAEQEELLSLLKPLRGEIVEVTAVGQAIGSSSSTKGFAAGKLGLDPDEFPIYRSQFCSQAGGIPRSQLEIQNPDRVSCVGP